jgi:hypothetical protein
MEEKEDIGIRIQNQNAQRIAMSDNKHDFSKEFNLSLFQTTSVNCLSDETILNENDLLKTLFNLERNEQNQFKYQNRSNASYQISYNSNFSNFIDNMADNPICIIQLEKPMILQLLLKTQ